MTISVFNFKDKKIMNCLAQSENWLSQSEVSQKFKLHKSTILRLERLGVIKAYRLPNVTKKLYSESEILQAMGAKQNDTN